MTTTVRMTLRKAFSILTWRRAQLVGVLITICYAFTMRAPRASAVLSRPLLDTQLDGLPLVRRGKVRDVSRPATR